MSKRLKRWTLPFILNAFRNGIRERYPICCVIAFCFGKVKGVAVRTSPHDVYRPCILHRKKSISDYKHLQLLNNGECPLDRNSFDRFGYYK